MIRLSRPRPGGGLAGAFRSRLMKGPRGAKIAGAESALGGAANVTPPRMASGMAKAGKAALGSARARAASALSKFAARAPSSTKEGLTV